MLTTRTAPSVERALDVREADAALIAGQRNDPAVGEAQPAGPVVDRDRLFDRAHTERDELIAGPHRVVVAPAAVGVDVQIGVGQRLADRANRRDVQRRSAPDLDLEGLDPELFVHRHGLVGHRGRLVERDHVGGRDIVREPAKQRVARAAQDLPDEVPDREVDSAARDVVSGDARRSARRRARRAEGRRPSSASLSCPLTASTIEACVSP